jgi:dipeptidase E
MKIILAGGGGASDSLPLDEIFAEWIGSHGRLLYLPIALRGARIFASCLEWIVSTFKPLDITDITMWTNLSEHQENELDSFNGVYIGGGNTYSLLAELRESGFDGYLKTYAARGKPIYGGSAGAVVLGRDIRTVNHMDRNKVGITETMGLDLAQGHAVWPHYEPQNDDLIHAYIEQHKLPVLAISEQSGIVIENSELRSAGFEPAFRFDRRGKTTPSS